VLLLDEVNERPYRLHRMLTQLRLAGILSRAAAIVFGEMPGCDEPEGPPTAREAMLDALATFEGPVVFGLSTGHAVHPALTVPLGVRTRVEALPDSARLVGEEPAVDAP
jgi:muramoyltetrapeptide carboxypeptidase